MNFSHFEGLYRDERYDPLIVCHISNQLAALLGARRGRVLFSRDTMLKQKRKHPELELADYRVLEACLMMGEYRQDTPSSAFIVYVDSHMNGCNYRAAIKCVGDTRVLYCTSFNRLRDRQLAQARRRPQPVIKAHD